MKHWRLHKKVWLWYNSWLAIQFVNLPELSLGLHLEPLRPLLDIFVGPFTIAIGNHPLLSDPRTKYRHSGRGFVYPEEIL